MRLSLILPIYGVEQYIAPCIESCCRQKNFDYSDCELILVDDSSPDHSIEIATSVLSRYPQVNYQIIKRPNGGLSAARNTGFEMASGDYVWFIDSDDWIEEDSLCTLTKAIVENPGVEIISFGHYNIYPHSRTSCELSSCMLGKTTGMDIIANTSFFSACNRIYSSALLKKYNILFREGILWEDGELNLRLFPLVSYHIGLSHVLYNYMRRPGSISTAGRVKHTLDSNLIKYDSIGEWFSNRPIGERNMRIVNSRRNEAIIFFLAGIPELPIKERKRYYSKIHIRTDAIQASFRQSSNPLHKMIGFFLTVAPSLFAHIFFWKMQKILKEEQSRMNI